MRFRPIVRKIANWVLPPAVEDLMRTGASRLVHGGAQPPQPPPPVPITPEVLLRNAGLFDKHRGERCFVLATGPSTLPLDLSPLAHETCIAVSEFYRHPQYESIRPAYYAFMQSDPELTPEFTPEFLKPKLHRLEELRQVAHRETFFFGLRDRPWVQTSSLVHDCDRVHYLEYGGERGPPTLDLTKPIPWPHGAVVLGIWIAIYLGFAEVYLLGCDNNHLWKWDGKSPFTRELWYHHCYPGAPVAGYEEMSVEFELRSMALAIDHYRWSVKVAEARGARIFNVNRTNYMNVFPLVAYEDLDFKVNRPVFSGDSVT